MVCRELLLAFIVLAVVVAAHKHKHDSSEDRDGSHEDRREGPNKGKGKGSQEKEKSPWFCRDYDCPKFTTQDNGGYEIRNYTASKWVVISTRSTRPELKKQSRDYMFKKLWGYLAGENTNQTRIEMSVPVLTKIESKGRFYKLSMMLYLGKPNPPTPTRGNVYLVTKEAGPVFVRSFPTWWWPKPRAYRWELNDLKKLVGDKKMYDSATYYMAAYNSPYDFFSRKQHEVWMDKK